MKKFYKSLIPFFGASLFKDPLSSLAKNITEPKEIFIGTKLEKTVHVKDQAKLAFEKEKNALNKKKVFLLVKNTTNKEKFGKNVLLLLGSQDYLSARQVNYEARQACHFNQIKDHNLDKKKKTYIGPKAEYALDFTTNKKNSNFASKFTEIVTNIKREIYFSGALNSRKNTFLKFGLKGGKSYFVRSEGGYKSICPVFFDENSAKNFLMENTGKNFKEHIRLKKMADHLNAKEKQLKIAFILSEKLNIKHRLPKLSKNIQDIKIICLGLGDFIEYYSTVPNKEALEKVEFFFIPKLDSINSKTKIACFPVKGNKRGSVLYQFKVKTDQSKLKGFKSYQRQLYEAKRYFNQGQLNQTRELANSRK